MIDEPSTSDPVPHVRLQRVSSRAPDRRFWAPVVVVLVLVVVAAFKPWPAAEVPVAAPARPAPVTPRPGTAAPTQIVESADSLAEPICLGAGSWRVASLEEWRTQAVRVWRAIEPLTEATGPADPAIPSVPVVAVELPALGWCAPTGGPSRPIGSARVEVWLVAAGQATPILVTRVAPVRDTALGALYSPARCGAGAWRDPSCPAGSSAAPGRVSWGPGRYTFRFEDHGNGAVAWFAVEIEILEELIDADPSAAPAPTRSP